MSLRTLLHLLAGVAPIAAWSGSDGTTCAFPTIDYLALDQGDGISATNAAAGMGEHVYVVGYMTGTLDISSFSTDGELKPTAAVRTTGDNAAFHVTQLDHEGRNLKVWLFELSFPFTSGFAFSGNNARTVHRFPDEVHIGAGFTMRAGDLTPPGLPTITNSNPSATVGIFCKINTEQDDAFWCQTIGQENTAGGSISSLDGTANGDMVVVVRTCETSTQLDTSGRNVTECTTHIQRRASVDGSLVWSKAMPLSVSSVRVSPNAGEIFVISTFTGDVDLGDGVTATSANLGADSSGLLIKMSEDGTTTWAATVGSSAGDMDLSHDGTTLAISSSSSVSKVSVDDGTIEWTATDLPHLRGVEVTNRDGPKYVLVYGQVTGDSSTHTLTDGAGSSVTLRSRGSFDLFVLKFDAETGTGLWAIDGGGDGMEYFWGMGMDNNDNVYISGYTRSVHPTFGPVSVTNPAQVGDGDRANRLYTIRLSGDERLPSCLSTCNLSEKPKSGCYIDHYCVEEGAIAPYGGLGCYVCDSSQDPFDWSGPSIENDCFIQGVCYADGDPRMVPATRGFVPSACEACDITKDKTAFSVKAGYTLDDDGACVEVVPSPATPPGVSASPPPPSPQGGQGSPPAAPAPPPRHDGGDDGLSDGAVAGIAVGCALGGFLIGAVLLYCLTKDSRKRTATTSKAREGPDSAL